MLSKESKIYVAGHHGLVGSAIWNNLRERGYTNLVGRSHSELELLDAAAVRRFFDEEKPDAVEAKILCQGKLAVHHLGAEELLSPYFHGCSSVGRHIDASYGPGLGCIPFISLFCTPPFCGADAAADQGQQS